MLKQRIITAVVLLALLVPAVMADDPRAFVLLSAVLIGAAGWEWSRLCGWLPWVCLLAGVVCQMACLFFWSSGGTEQPLPLVWLTMGTVWVLTAAGLLKGGVPLWLQVPALVRWLTGIIALFAAWVALVQAQAMGINFLFSIFFLVWGADVAAYFCGRLWGGRWIHRKLAAQISPGKTWEGALGGFAVVLLLTFVWQYLEASGQWLGPSLYARLALHGPVFLVVSVAFLTTMSVAGDLLESLFKRAAGVKDSSQLLPGHGGVLDRIDALLPVLPLAMLLCVL